MTATSHLINTDHTVGASLVGAQIPSPLMGSQGQARVPSPLRGEG
ncbi:MAG: hypothetical protein F4X94_00850 [Dehalococcoidia bacterium]|nr:hypothetical protein [Dehalococcoidia bacterium]